MFTGIVTHIGRVRRVVKGGDTRIEIACDFDARSLARGASVSCAGCCLTVVAKGRGWFAVQASAETLSKTTLGTWRRDVPVNLERALKVGDELGGHHVAGHVDGVGTVVARRREGESIRLVFSVPAALGRLVAPKGSVAIDGVSLTVNDVKDTRGKTRFGVNVIAHTAATTTLGGLGKGDRVNVEIDMLARYVARLGACVRPGGEA
jgi:riboflavin synthase